MKVKEVLENKVKFKEPFFLKKKNRIKIIRETRKLPFP